METWLDWYERGLSVMVWTEMTSLGADLRSDEEGWPVAQAVARETMKRARANVERLVELLPEIGYAFEGEPFKPPASDMPEQLDALEDRIGLLPLALRAWFEEVGEVDLVGTHPDWDVEYPDPLEVAAPVEYILNEFEAWQHDLGTEFERGTFFEVPIGRDHLLKAGISGGPPYGLAVPNPGADGLVLWEYNQTTLVNYLRIAFRYGGMPGWLWSRPGKPPPPELAEVARQMLAI